ncbi:hypothetical protein TVAG_284270 [Trichomonas vaginalis G3]|uniref:F5/8 type C domain-containing protein n=1 Tax=Trichomonas vaginalis (strain ATCC PRA-98 / G3) TaxID=412133 RepID=A2G3E7_TRIV3|nr:galactose-binding domain-like family [Trichomonas vaginalis G3]EAX88321.1 hypothetical protein TVAG_284270 [Trichomonas vaginalis G3]KAI5498842.1 galactose-binding domain-like family [Trichomonas vaginalis G3]|eukprot:XP_001301251.1 hypothetical protein [Trichomonas vaginalis G3]
MFLILFESIGSITYDNGIFQKHYNEGDIIVTASGSSKQQINDTDQLTKPEYAIYPWEKKYDWCSQISHSYEDHPYIVFAMKSKKFKFNGYFVRCGCCYDGCCCDDDYYHYCLDCCLYSWSLQISDDNKTWKTIHQVEKDDSMRICSEKEYHLDKEYISRYVRLIQDKPCPGYPPCIAINKFDLYGNSVGDDSSRDDEFVSYHDDDDDVSIIGHISKNGRL